MVAIGGQRIDTFEWCSPNSLLDQIASDKDKTVCFYLETLSGNQNAIIQPMVRPQAVR